MKKLKKILAKKSGRSSNGRMTVRHQGGRRKRYLREIDFKRDKRDVWGIIEAIEYDPNRNCDIALVLYEDGERRYILSPSGLELGQKIISSESAPLNLGNVLPLLKIPIGSQIHNLEIYPGKGGQMVKSAGSSAVIQGKEKDFVVVKLPSGEVKRFKPESFATLGQVSRAEKKAERIGKAGRKRKMGIRPTVRGIAMHPAAHPHGGGEGRSGIGLKYPKTPYGKPAVGKTRKKKKYSDKLIIKGRKPGPHVGI
ncbi:50S ribosomal protein L2 [Candidatus Woesebacteria bacterium RBG_16_34_12]|uniref:Large ribosomal subunit protein uL2 n=1 Tax=Candidatus Woesebacteria bacterium RBG_16_34_12 TaxID=1802480 RepID=A0A1F7XB92_9BACT|nr:MAG: 50S ribosomal protein L2 [Candidatus Woesebacteria bacterium RBG_16_34_12]